MEKKKIERKKPGVESKIIEMSGYKIEERWQWTKEELKFILDQLKPNSAGKVLPTIKIIQNARNTTPKLRAMNDREISEFKKMNEEKLKKLK